jgi:hypothetical protein
MRRESADCLFFVRLTISRPNSPTDCGYYNVRIKIANSATRMSKDMDDLGDSPQEEETNEITTEITELPVCYIATGKMTWDEAWQCIKPNIDFANAFLVKQGHDPDWTHVCYKSHRHGDTCICVLESSDYYDHPELKRLEFGGFCDHGQHREVPWMLQGYRYNCKDCGDTCMLDCCTYVKSGIVTNVFS